MSTSAARAYVAILSAFASSFALHAQPPAMPTLRPHRITAFFWHDSPNDNAALRGIRDGLVAASLPHELVERRADADAARAETLLRAIREQRPDLVFAMGTQAAILAKAALRDVPIVHVAVTNPVAAGLAPTFDASGTNLTGASNWIPAANVLRVFQQAVPDLRRLGILRTKSAGVVSAAEAASMRSHLASPGAPAVTLVEVDVDGPDDLEAGVQKLVTAGVHAIWVPIDLDVYQHVDRIRKALGRTPLPILTTSLQAARTGATTGVLVDYGMLGQKAAGLAIRILREGTRPGDLPVAIMHSYQVVVNLGAARRAGIQLPLSLLVLADELIDEETPRGR